MAEKEKKKEKKEKKESNIGPDGQRTDMPFGMTEREFRRKRREKFVRDIKRLRRSIDGKSNKFFRN